MIDNQTYVEATAGYGIDIDENLSASIDASVGYLQQSDAAVAADPTLDDGFHNYSIGASLGYALSEAWSVGLSAMYVGQIDDAVLPDTTTGGVGYDVDFVGMLSLTCDM